MVLFLHVLGAIAVFGLVVAFPLMNVQAGRSPDRRYFIAELIEVIERQLVLSGAVLQGLTGAALIGLGDRDLASPEGRYPIISIVLYLAAIALGILVQLPATNAMVHLTGERPALPLPGIPNPSTPEEVITVVRRLAWSSRFMVVLIVAVVFLMVVKPVLGS